MQRAKVEREVGRMLQRAGRDAHPIEHLLDELARSGALTDVLATMVDRLDAEGSLTQYNGVSGASDLHPVVEWWHRERQLRGSLAKAAVDAGVAEYRARLSADQAEQVMQVLAGAAADLGPDTGSTQVRQAIARRLRALEAAT
jgi:hypothetical protein